MAHKPTRILAFLLTAVLTFTVSLSAVADENDNGYYDDNNYNYNDGDDTYYEEPDTTEETDETNTDTDEEESDDTENFTEEDYEQQQSDLEEENRQLQEQLQLTAEEIAEKQQTVKDLQQQITELKSRINAANDHIDTLNTEIADKQRQIEEKKAEIEDVLALLRVRLRTIHTAGDTSSLEIILGAKNFSDFLDKAEMIKSMSEYDNNLITSIEKQAAEIAAEQQELQNKKLTVEAEKAQLEKDNKHINELLDENSRLVEELLTTQKKLENDQKENEAKQDELQKAWERYQERLAAEEEERQRLAAEEEERQREENKKHSNEIITPSTNGQYVWPCPGFTYLTSTFDEWRGENNHGALDIAEAGIYGAKVVACYDGVVFSTWEYCTHDYGKDASCGCGGGYGNYVMIDHGDGKISIYGHLSGVTVSIGQTVKAGQLIGYVGSTGYSTGAHLHFETRYNNVRYDPLSEY